MHERIRITATEQLRIFRETGDAATTLKDHIEACPLCKTTVNDAGDLCEDALVLYHIMQAKKKRQEILLGC